MTTALTKRETQDLIISRDARQAAKALIHFAPQERVEIIAEAFDGIVAQDPPLGLSQAGSQIEKVLDEMDEQNEDTELIKTLEALAQEGEIEIIFRMIQSQAGEISSVAERVSSQILCVAIENDPDINWPETLDGDFSKIDLGKLIEILYSIVVLGTNQGMDSIPAIVQFVNGSGEQFLNALKALNDEDAQEVLRVATYLQTETIAEIPVKEIEREIQRLDNDDDDDDDKDTTRETVDLDL